MRRIAGLAMHVYEDMGIGRFFNISRSLFLKTKSGTHLKLGSISAKRRHEIKFNEIHRNDFYEKDTVVLDIPKGPKS